jgi:hypothetical protein
MSRDLVIGIFGGLLSALIVFIVGLFAKRILLPAVANYLYQGPNLSGEWNCYDLGDENAERTGTAEVGQKREEVKMILHLTKTRAGHQINKRFEYKGQLASGQLTLLFEDMNLRRFVTGAVVLKLLPDHRTLVGKTVYFDHNLGTVVAHELWLRRVD